MLLLTSFSRFNQWAGPFVLGRVYLPVRSALGRVGSQPVVDAVFLHPFAKLVSIECHHHYQDDSVVKESMANGDVVGAAERRVRILESKYVKPHVLAKHWWAWSEHERFKKWARSEYLLARHGPAIQKSFQHIKKSPQFQPKKRAKVWSVLGGGGSGDNDSSSVSASAVPSQHPAGAEAGMPPLVSRLPTTRQLEAWLDTKHWAVHKDTDANARAMAAIAGKVGGSVQASLGGAYCVADLPDDEDEDDRSVIADDDDGQEQEINRSASQRPSLSDLTLEELIELSGGHVRECGPLNALCEHYGQNQVYTREYVHRLGEYLAGQQQEAGATGTTTQPNPAGIILDVGAGDGPLVQLLNDYFDSLHESNSSSSSSSSTLIQRGGALKPTVSGPRALRRGGPNGKTRNPLRGKRRIVSTSSSHDANEDASIRRPLVAVATDDGSWRISARAPVERLSVEEALEKYAPIRFDDDDKDDDGTSRRLHRPRVTVLCSWMPMGLDWTALFRMHEVDEYILVGECDDGQCGHNWETWGNAHFRPSDRGSAKDSDAGEGGSADKKPSDRLDSDASESPLPTTHVRPPHEVDGHYERRDLDFLAPYQFSRYDSRVSKSGRTVSFRRRLPRGGAVVGVALPRLIDRSID
jgi:hypothetical protein